MMRAGVDKFMRRRSGSQKAQTSSGLQINNAAPSHFEPLMQNIENRSATIGIVGLGYVGLPLLLRFCDAGFTVVGFDVETTKIEMLGSGFSFIQHISSSRVAAARQQFFAKADLLEISNCDVVTLCVPTPLTKNRDPDLSYIVKTMTDILPSLRKNGVVLCFHFRCEKNVFIDPTFKQAAIIGKG